MEQNSETTAAPESGDVESTTEAASAPRRRSRRASVAAGEVVEPPTGAGAPEPEPSVDSGAAKADEAPKQRVSRARKKAASAEHPEAANAEADSSSGATAGESAPSAPSDAEEPDARKSATRTSRSRAKSAASDAADETASTEEEAPRKRRSTRAKKNEETSADSASAEGVGDASASSDSAADSSASNDESGTGKEASSGGRRRSSSQGRASKSSSKDSSQSSSKGSARSASDAGEQGDSDTDSAKPENGKNGEQGDGEPNGNDRRGGSNRNGRGRGDGSDEGQQRQGRTRQRERKRRGQSDDLEPELTEDDVLLPVAGILDVLDNYAFVRTSGYLSGPNDVYVSLGQVKKYGLRRGDSVVGAIRQPREGEGGGRQKYNAIVRVDTVNSRGVDENETRLEFSGMTPIHPTERLRLETEATEFTQRVIDLFAPVGKGQRGIVSGPREAGKSTALRRIAAAVAENQPDAHLMMVLVDERPEDVTELQRTVNGEVVASTFDRSPEDHVTLAELAIERAKRLVELGHDVVVLIDSLTSLARSYNALSSSRVPAGNLDAVAVYPVKKMLGAARNLENGGSLTIIGTVSDQPGSRVDEAVIGELDATANMRLVLSGEAADRRVFPAVDLTATSTRHAELLTSESEAKVMNHLRRTLSGAGGEPGLEAVLQRLSETSSNVEFLALTQRAQVAS